MLNFINHWATLTRGRTPANPIFFPYSASNTGQVPEYLSAVVGASKIKYAIRRFVFPNSKLNDLKIKINNMATTPVNPSRVESLTSLLFKSAVDAAATIKSRSLKPPLSLSLVVNLRKIISTDDSKLAAGNLAITVIPKLASDLRKIELNEVITSLRKEILEVQGLRDMRQAGEKLADTVLTLVNDQSRAITFSSVCRFPFYQVDFGWGKPERVIIRAGNVDGACVTFMDTPSGDGIEATVQLEEEEMAIFQKDKKFLAYVQDVV